MLHNAKLGAYVERLHHSIFASISLLDGTQFQSIKLKITSFIQDNLGYRLNKSKKKNNTEICTLKNGINKLNYVNLEMYFNQKHF